MKVYTNSMYGRGTIFVTPGAEHPETSAFVNESLDGEGRTVRQPIQFAVKFENGAAEVDDQLGRYLLDKKMVRKNPPLLIPTPPSERPAESGRIVYAKPIPVGMPLRPVVSET